MENTIGEMLLITVSYELLPITPSLLNHVQFNWKKNGQMRGSFYARKRDVCFLILQKCFRTSSFDSFFLKFKVWSCSRCYSTLHLQCIQKWARDGAAYTQLTSDDTLNPAELPWYWYV